MVLPIMAARGAFGAGIGLLSGLGMGFGYGYGVRAGYNAYKPSKSSQINNMVMSPEPMTSGAGMGLHTAEQRTGNPGLSIQGLTDTPTPEGDPTKGYFNQEEYTHPFTKERIPREDVIRRGYRYGLEPKISIHRFQKGVYPFNKFKT